MRSKKYSTVFEENEGGDTFNPRTFLMTVVLCFVVVYDHTRLWVLFPTESCKTKNKDTSYLVCLARTQRNK